MPRLFVGIDVPGGQKKRLDSLVTALQGRLASGVRWTRAGNWHVTLQFLGQVEDFSVDAIRASLRCIEFEMFASQVGELGCFPDMRKPRVVWAGMRQGNDGCVRLAEAVKDAMDAFGFKRGNQPVKAHLTLGRMKRLEDEDFVKVFNEVSPEWSEFMVTTFTLWESELTPDGPVYTVVEEFPLRQTNG